MGAVTVNGYTGVAGRNEGFFSNPNGISRFVDGNDGNDIVFGANIDDRLLGGLGQDLVFGADGNDDIFGDRFWDDATANANQSLAAAADAMWGEGGDDVIYGGGGNNFANGGAGNDYVVGGDGAEFLQGGAGNDIVSGLAGNDTLFGGTDTEANQNAFLAANVGTISTSFDGETNAVLNNSFNGGIQGFRDPALTNTGDDFLDGGKGDDLVNGQDGNDTLIGGEGKDTLFGGAGNDLILDQYAASAADKTLEIGNGGNDTLYGGSANDTLYGDDTGTAETGNDLLWGADGNDVIFGGNGADNLVGSNGSDLLFGGAGADYFNLYFDVKPGDIDYILDFGAGDVILLPATYQSSVYFFESGGYGFGYVGGAGGTYYLFGALGLTTAQVTAATAFF
jgi:Ca2+-binding RTX toxin-like protein